MGSGRRPPSAARAAAISLRPANTISLRSAKKLTTPPRNSSAPKNRVKLLRENVVRAVRENITTPARATGDRLMSTMDRMTAATDPLMSLRVSRKKLSATSKTQAQTKKSPKKDEKKDSSCRKQWRICDVDDFWGGFGPLYHRRGRHLRHTTQ